MVRPWPDFTKVASDFWSNLVKKLASGMFSAPDSADNVASEGEVWPVSTFDSMPGLSPAAAARSLRVMPSAVRKLRICAPTSASNGIFGLSGKGGLLGCLRQGSLPAPDRQIKREARGPAEPSRQGNRKAACPAAAPRALPDER